MLKSNLWKLALSIIIVVWAVLSLTPLQDQPFADHAQSAVTAKSDEFATLMAEARASVSAGTDSSEFVALKRITQERQIELKQFFPTLNLGGEKNTAKANALILDHLLAESKAALQLGLDLKGGVAFTLEVKDDATTRALSDTERQEKLSKAIEIISDRINSFGVAEPIVRPVGANRIEVQLPGINTQDNPEILESIKKPAQLDFRLVHASIPPTASMPREVPPGYEAMELEIEDRNTGEISSAFYLVKRLPEMTGKDVVDAYPVMDAFGGVQVTLQFNNEGKERFAAVTTANVGRQLGIVLDGKLYSAPNINEPITGGSAQISGRFTQIEAARLADVLNNPLDLPLAVAEQYEVGPSLAQDAITSGLNASMIGGILVVLFMLIVYTVGGVLAVISLIVNLLIVVGVLASLGATLSLPGIAGIVLTVGMAVDANILIFERIREELNMGKSLKAALHAGHDKVYSTILDANITTLITSGLMIAFGTGPVKGFGVTLTIGIFATMFSALVVTKMLLEILIDGNVIKKFPMLIRSAVPKIDYLKYARVAFIISWTIVLIGIVVVVAKGHRIYGIDFVGGDEVMITFNPDHRIDEGALRETLEGALAVEVNPFYQSDLGGSAEVLKVQVPFEQGPLVLKVLNTTYPDSAFASEGINKIGPAVGAEIQWNAFMALGLALVGILIYVAFRFEMGYSLGAVAATVHDILMTIGIFVLFGRQFTAPMVAAILLVAGYSINDTIVVFDRIREELKLNPVTKLRDVINAAINKVLVRSILTSATTFLAALSLFVFGGGVINDLALTFMVGVAAGTVSSIFIASPIFFWFHKGKRSSVEKHEDAQPVYEWSTGATK